MAQAGYDSGANLGQLEYLYVDEGVHAAVAEALCQMWHETLGLEITPRGVTEQELWTALRSGDYTIAATRVGAAGNDAECFLMQWTTSSPDNVVGYSNSAYDTLMSIIASASDGTARMGCLHDAEELLLTDSALSPLYYRRTDWQLRENLTGACRDAPRLVCICQRRSQNLIKRPRRPLGAAVFFQECPRSLGRIRFSKTAIKVAITTGDLPKIMVAASGNWLRASLA